MKKVDVLRALDVLPEEFQIERLMYTLYLRREVERGLADIEAEREVSLEEIDRMIDTWPE